MKIRILFTLSITALVSTIFANLAELPAIADRVASTEAAKSELLANRNNGEHGTQISTVVTNAVTFNPVNPAATYLRTNDDPNSQSASPIALSSLGVAPGDTIRLNFRGRFLYASCPDCYSASMIGVFSSSNTITGPENHNRIPGAIASNGPPIGTMPTASGGVPTDIQEDFSVQGPEAPVLVTVPTGANYLFVSAHDSYFGDNSVAPGESFGLEIDRTGRSKIVFERTDGDLTSNGIFVMNPDGTNQQRLTGPSGVNYDSSPKWSPDGTKIAFVRSQRSPTPGQNPRIFVMNSDGTNVTQLTYTEFARDFSPNWSPDGSKIVFSRDQYDPTTGGIQGIFVMNSDGSGQVPLFTRTGPSSDWYAYSPDWSPDGSKIAIAHNSGVYTINPDGTNPVRLTPENVICRDSAWSPDSSKITYICLVGTGEIFVINRDGSGQTRLTNNSSDEGRPTWSPDGTRIAFDRQFAGIVLINPDGTNEQQVTFTGVDYWPDWGLAPSGASISGRVFDATGTVGISGVTISLNGTSSGQRITDATGNYSFTNLMEGGDYTVSASMGGYQFEPQQHIFNDLIGSAMGNFTTPTTYDLTIEAFEPVQAVYYPAGQPVQLVKDKATAAKIGVRVSDLQKFNQHQGSQNVSLQITSPGQTFPTFSCSRADFVPDQTGPAATCTKHFQLPSPALVGSADYVLNISVPGGIESNTSNNQAIRTANITDTGNLKILFVQMNGPRIGVFGTYPDAPNVPQTRDLSRDFIKKAFPLNESALQTPLHPTAIYGSWNTNQVPIFGSSGAMILDLWALHRLADETFSDKVVGVVHYDYFDKFLRKRCVQGIRFDDSTTENGVIVTASNTYNVPGIGNVCPGAMPNSYAINLTGNVTAHEIGHSLGIPGAAQEEYRTNRPNGNLVGTTGYSAYDMTPIPSTHYCFMGNQPNAWIDLNHFEFLRNGLVTRFSDRKNTLDEGYSVTTAVPSSDLAQHDISKYLVVGLVVKNQQVVNMPSYVTVNPAIRPNPSKTYRIRSYDMFGNLLSSIPANYTPFSDTIGCSAIEDCGGQITNKLPLNHGLATLEIEFDGNVIARFNVPGMLLRDAIKGIPDSGLKGDPLEARNIMSANINAFEEQIEKGEYHVARQMLEKELRSLINEYVREHIEKTSFLEYDRIEVEATLDIATEIVRKWAYQPNILLLPSVNRRQQ